MATGTYRVDVSRLLCGLVEADGAFHLCNVSQTDEMLGSSAVDWDRVAEAIVVWTGKDRLAWPHRDDRRVVDRFGAAAAAGLLPLVRRLYDEFYDSDAHLRAASLSEMAALASADFRKKHPQLSASAIDALAWCYTFDYK